MSWTTVHREECSALTPGDSGIPSWSAEAPALSGLTGVPPARGSRQPLAEPSAGGHPRAEWRLTGRVFARCHRFILEACKFSSICPEFLGALTANESGGRPNAVRFEPAVYRHLKSVAGGQSQSYGGIRPHDLAAEVDEILQPKAQMFHARYLDSPFAERHGQALSPLEDEALRELASSWGFTQIMGFHMIGRPGTVRNLLDPRFHFRLATQLLAEFAQDYQLDLRCEFAELFRCWNTGQPYGVTTDPAYAEKGLRRMELYREYVAARHTTAGPSP